MGLQAFLSRQVVTSEGIRPGAILVEGERILTVLKPGEVPASATCEDFGNAALLPGLVTVTVAVKVTPCPNTDVPADDTAVLVAALLTVWLAVLLLVVKLPSPA